MRKKWQEEERILIIILVVILDRIRMFTFQNIKKRDLRFFIRVNQHK